MTAKDNVLQETGSFMVSKVSSQFTPDDGSAVTVDLERIVKAGETPSAFQRVTIQMRKKAGDARLPEAFDVYTLTIEPTVRAAQ